MLSAAKHDRALVARRHDIVKKMLGSISLQMLPLHSVQGFGSRAQDDRALAERRGDTLRFAEA